jgi:hypothetical protein
MLPLRDGARVSASGGGVRMIDHFAEHLSHHGDIAKAAAQLGQSLAWGKRQFREICRELGEQAA